MSLGWIALGVAVIGAAVSTTLSLVSLHNQKKAAKRQMEITQLNAKTLANERMKKIRKIAGQQKSSFLSSGISLTGDGTTDAVLGDTYDTGKEDVNTILQRGSLQGAALKAEYRAKQMDTYGGIAAEWGSVAMSAAGQFGQAGKVADPGSFGDVATLDGMGSTGMGDLGSFSSGLESFGKVDVPGAGSAASKFGGGMLKMDNFKSFAF